MHRLSTGILAQGTGDAPASALLRDRNLLLLCLQTRLRPTSTAQSLDAAGADADANAGAGNVGDPVAQCPGTSPSESSTSCSFSVVYLLVPVERRSVVTV